MVPNGWDYKTFANLIKSGDITQIQDGNHGNSHPKSSDFVSSGIPFIMARDINGGNVNLSSCAYLTKQQADSLRIGFSLPGDVLLSHKGTVGQVAIVPPVDNYIMLTPQVTYYRLPRKSKLYNLYLYHYFLSNGFQERLKYLSAQSTRSYIGITAQKELPILLPPILEQRKIAKILSTWDKAISSTEKLLVTSEQQKIALMQQLLTGKKRLIDPETGKAFERKWEEVKLDDISTITRLAGAEYSDVWETKDNGEIIALRGFNIGKNKLILRNIERIDNHLSLKLSRSRLNKNDIVFPCVGSIGKACLIIEDGKFHINQNIAKITPSQNVVPLFLTFCLLSKRSEAQILQYNTSSSQPNVLVGNLRKFKFTVPATSKEQQKIATVLSAADKEIEVLEAKLAHFKQEKKALMQQLLTGKRRVKVDEMEVA